MFREKVIKKNLLKKMVYNEHKDRETKNIILLIRKKNKRMRVYPINTQEKEKCIEMYRNVDLTVREVIQICNRGLYLIQFKY